jgi:hypothetical protein
VKVDLGLVAQLKNLPKKNAAQNFGHKQRSISSSACDGQRVDHILSLTFTSLCCLETLGLHLAKYNIFQAARQRTNTLGFLIEISGTFNSEPSCQKLDTLLVKVFELLSMTAFDPKSLNPNLKFVFFPCLIQDAIEA